MSNANWYISKEYCLSETYETEIEPFWHQCVSTGDFVGCGQVKVRYASCIPDEAVGSVVISSGRIESLLKYKEVIYELYQNQFAVFILDHRGQGLSGRLSDNPHHGYVDHFDDYVHDLSVFINNVVKPQQKGDLHLLCHSMGSAIGALYILKNPTVFDNVIFCSPMFGIRPAMPEWLAKLLINTSRLVNQIFPRSGGYFFGQGDYHPVIFEQNALTSSKIRYQLFRNLYHQNPAIQLGGVTPQWLAAASSAMWEIEQSADQINLPVLVFSAANDSVVDNNRQAKVVKRIPQATLIEVADARHELLIESDSIRQPVMEQILTFLTQ